MLSAYVQKLIFTVDVEGPRGKDPIKHQIWGETGDGSEYGIRKIIEKLDQYKIKGLFFVDFAEAFDLGEEKIAEVVKYIDDKGHDIGVHLHPHHMGDIERHFLWQYTKEEQKDMIEKCTKLYEKILGRRPKSFRAGKYGANYETLEILNMLGYQYDFSEFYGQKWCGITPELTKVLPSNYKGLMEFPVTIFKSFDFFGLYKRYDKLDFNITPSEMHHILKAYQKKANNVLITVFAHSFSLLNFLERPDQPIPNKIAGKRLDSFLNYVNSKPFFQFINEKDLEQFDKDYYESKEIDIARNYYLTGFWYLFLRALPICKYNRLAKILVGT